MAIPRRLNPEILTRGINHRQKLAQMDPSGCNKLPRVRHPRSPWIQESKPIMLSVKLFWYIDQTLLFGHCYG